MESSPSHNRTPHRLREGLADPRRNPTHNEPRRIRARVAESLTHITPLFPGNPDTGILNEDYEDLDPLRRRSRGRHRRKRALPVLDPTTGTCDLYDARPIVCRTFGPPMRTSEGDLATCELCFIYASTDEIIAAELDPTIPEQEAASNEAFNVAHHTHGETIIAYALRNA